ncbi:HIG1 domain family member 1A, mitochondrial, partial [Armadillidium vulgare]
LLGLTGIVGYGLYGIRQRKMPMSLYLIQMRVGAQGFVVTCLTLGIAYSMFREYLYPKISDRIHPSNGGDKGSDS